VTVRLSGMARADWLATLHDGAAVTLIDTYGPQEKSLAVTIRSRTRTGGYVLSDGTRLPATGYTMIRGGFRSIEPGQAAEKETP
jgi:hypothetical protein